MASFSIVCGIALPRTLPEPRKRLEHAITIALWEDGKALALLLGTLQESCMHNIHTLASLQHTSNTSCTLGGDPDTTMPMKHFKNQHSTMALGNSPSDSFAFPRSHCKPPPCCSAPAALDPPSHKGPPAAGLGSHNGPCTHLFAGKENCAFFPLLIFFVSHYSLAVHYGTLSPV